MGPYFEEVERDALLKLPIEGFPSFQEAQRTVHRDGHIEVGRAYYSVPPEYLGHRVWVRWDTRMVRIFNDRMEPIQVHARQEPGRFSTPHANIVAQKTAELNVVSPGNWDTCGVLGHTAFNGRNRSFGFVVSRLPVYWSAS